MFEDTKISHLNIYVWSPEDRTVDSVSINVGVGAEFTDEIVLEARRGRKADGSKVLAGLCAAPILRPPDAKS